MKKINLKGIEKILNEKELKNVMGGSWTFNCSGDDCDRGNWCTTPYGIELATCGFIFGKCACLHG